MVVTTLVGAVVTGTEWVEARAASEHLQCTGQPQNKQ